MSEKILIFGGTTEGREICEALSWCGREACVFTATDYGGSLLHGLPNIEVRSGRLDAAAMAACIRAEDVAQVIDATHPFAREVTLNIREACAATGAEYLRVIRDEQKHPEINTVENVEAAVDFLAATEGAVLLSTGSKELAAFCRLPGYRERLYARVLPMPEVISHCNELGFSGAHIIAMQGPFSYELNAAMLRHYGCKYLVTKNTGPAGGLDEKIAAALDMGVEAVIIDRPMQEYGLSMAELFSRLGLEGPGEVPAVPGALPDSRQELK